MVNIDDNPSMWIRKHRMHFYMVRKYRMICHLGEIMEQMNDEWVEEMEGYLDRDRKMIFLVLIV